MYSVLIAYFLYVVGGFGALGFHRFYLGKFGTGLLYLCTGGLAGVGMIYDFFTLPMQVREANIESRYRRALGMNQAAGIRDVASAFRSPRSSRESIERIILKTAKANNGIATPVEVALSAECSLDETKRTLEQLVSQGFAEMRVSKTGKLLYVFPDFVTEETEALLEDF